MALRLLGSSFSRGGSYRALMLSVALPVAALAQSTQEKPPPPPPPQQDAPRGMDPCLLGTWVAVEYRERNPFVTGGGTGFRVTFKSDGTQIVDYAPMQPIRAGEDAIIYSGMGVAKISTREGVATIESMLNAGVSWTLAIKKANVHTTKLPGLGVGGLGATKDANAYKCDKDTLVYQGSAARDLHATSTLKLARVAAAPTSVATVNPSPPMIPSPSAPPATNVCGPDITKPLKRVLTTALDDYRALSRTDRITQCAGLGFWDIGVLRARPASLAPKGCATKGPCADTVMVGGTCYRAGLVNYAIFGVIEYACGARLVGETLHKVYALGKWVGGLFSTVVDGVSGLFGGSKLLDFAGTSYKITSLESQWIRVGYLYAQDGVLVQLPEVSADVAACTACPGPPKPFGWRYTWMPLCPNNASR